MKNASDSLRYSAIASVRCRMRQRRFAHRWWRQHRHHAPGYREHHRHQQTPTPTHLHRGRQQSNGRTHRQLRNRRAEPATGQCRDVCVARRYRRHRVGNSRCGPENGYRNNRAGHGQPAVRNDRRRCRGLARQQDYRRACLRALPAATPATPPHRRLFCARPAPGATNVGIGQSVSVQFSEPMNSSSVAGAFQWTWDSGIVGWECGRGRRQHLRIHRSAAAI